MMAAMCLGFTAGREEEGFWIFTYLMEARLYWVLGERGALAFSLPLLVPAACGRWSGACGALEFLRFVI